MRFNNILINLLKTLLIISFILFMLFVPMSKTKINVFLVYTIIITVSAIVATIKLIGVTYFKGE